jgi:hypothetical protein
MEEEIHLRGVPRKVPNFFLHIKSKAHFFLAYVYYMIWYPVKEMHNFNFK